jgi:endonuclease/exonuclease/phosphatase family metal-dependent hydrolase
LRPLRCLTLNLWGAEAPLQRRMELVVAGLRDLQPDVVGLQEVREVPGQLPNQAEMLASALGYHYVYMPAMPFAGGHEGLAILSRGPILEHVAFGLPHAQAQERRILLSARVAFESLSAWVHTTHLNYRLAHGKHREDQVQAIDSLIAARAGDTPSMLMGDFNARPEADEIRWLRGQVTLGGRRTYYQDAWERLHPGERGWTWASANPYTKVLEFLEPDRRLDYIFVTPMRRDGRARIHSCEIVLNKPAADGAFASDHFGLMAEIQMTGDPN